MIKSVSSGLMIAYNQFVTGRPKTEKEMFTYFSASIGGDGRTISKSQLDSYIEKIDSGAVKTSKRRTSELKNLQQNWKKYYNDKDEISLDDFKKHLWDFISIMTAEDEEEDDDDDKKNKIKEKLKEKNEKLKEDLKSQTQETLDRIKEKLNIKDKEGITKNDLKDYLNDLLSKTEENSETESEVATVTNLLADFATLTNNNEYLQEIPVETDLTNSHHKSISTKNITKPINIKV